MKLNTPGQKDGVLELAVNGQKRSLSTVRWRNNTAQIMGVQIHPFFGGGSDDYAPPRQTRAWYADFQFSNT